MYVRVCVSCYFKIKASFDVKYSANAFPLKQIFQHRHTMLKYLFKLQMKKIVVNVILEKFD